MRVDPGWGPSVDYLKHKPLAPCKRGVWQVKVRPAPPYNKHYLPRTGYLLRKSHASFETRRNYVYALGAQKIERLGNYTCAPIMHHSLYTKMQTSAEMLTAFGLQVVLSFPINMGLSFIGGVKDRRLWPSLPQTQNSTPRCLH